MKTLKESIDSRTVEFKIIEPTEQAVESFGVGYGCELLEVSEQDVKDLLAGKAWAFGVNGGEYVHFVLLSEVPCRND